MENAENIILGAFIGDSLALGPHWVYDQDVIRQKLGRVSSLHAPISSYHPGKNAGAFTHYGDQALLLLRSIRLEGRFDLDSFATSWRQMWESDGTISYKDGATKATLANLQAGASPLESGSASHDVAGASRMAPLFLLEMEEADFISNVGKLTGFTHRDPQVLETAEFFARVILSILKGDSMHDALETTMARGWKHLPEEWLRLAAASAASADDDGTVLEGYGLDCSTESAFSGICHLLLRYPEDPATALIENASAGGDCAARGMILGMIYGARFPVSEWPQEWLTGMQAHDQILELTHDAAKN